MSDQPQAMTLEEALRALQERKRHFVPPEPGTDSWGVVEVLRSPAHEFGSWPEAASHALGYRVVERDPTAELVEALYEALEKTEPFLEYLAQDGHEGALDLLEHVMYTLIKSSAARAALREAGVTDDA